MKKLFRSEKSFGLFVYTFIEGELLFLLVHMNDKPKSGDWTFSKGHYDNEDGTEVNTAIRELKEETSLELEDLTIDSDKIKSIEYSYEENNTIVNKSAKYFLAFCKPTSINKVKPDLNEIEEIRWLKYQDAISILTYELDKSILEHYKNILEATILH